MSPLKCRCEGLSGLDLVRCLAPPPGDYEVSLEAGRGRELIINSEGVYLRSVVSDDYLPFIRTADLRVSGEALRTLGFDLESLLCEAVKGLLNASQHGSQAASEKAAECTDLVNSVLESCAKQRVSTNV
ncbi:hypothetical protein [Acidilobus sp. 7A]|uniref:hypothetical protein n=1 Tax=Acidilobus sp. 7A TaxID=1577685 RepID=UPI0011E4D39A|nr:hypothetical protein [Acidilobus sp. 7A]